MLKFSRVAVTLDVKVPQQALEKHIPASPYVVGEEIAEQTNNYVLKTSLGYYPALDFLKQQEALDKDLVDTIENISWFVSNLVREELTIRLRPAFSNIRFENISLHAFKMPSVRPGHNNALHLLASHYTPNRAHVSLTVTSIKKYDDAITAERMTKNMIYRWLNDHMASLNITSVHYIEDDNK